MELLAPAGSEEALYAAVSNGADAVYLGYGDFNARRGAKNFSSEELAAAVSYCHLRGVKLYLTLNTLLSDRELQEAHKAAAFASDTGVDAVLVQDIGLLSLLRKTLPDLPLHASTQMGIHNLAGAEFCAALGMERVVLARETGGADIRAVCASATAEIECFVHGALCISHSGQCYFSALLGGRSGNRGLCAQPCRLAYQANGAEKPTHPLSLKDLSLAGQLNELREMGVACLKLEGRMKRPEYVAVVTRIFAGALKEARLPTKEEDALLAQIFSRSGFTQGYFHRRVDQTMFGIRRENEAPPEAVYAKARESYVSVERRQVPLLLSAEIRTGKPARLRLRDESGNAVEVFGPVPEPARSKALAAEAVEAQLSKTGGTVFSCRAVSVALDEGLSLPVSALNALRREGLAAMEARRTQVPTRRSFPFAMPKIAAAAPPDAPSISLCVRRLDQLSPASLAQKPARVWLPLEVASLNAKALSRLQTENPATRFGVSLPRVVFDSEWGAFLQQLDACRAGGVSDCLVGNWGLIEAAKKRGFALHGDYGLSLFNSLAAEELHRLGFAAATVSFELNLAQIADLQSPLPLSLIAYGRLPLMLLEHDLSRMSPLTDRRGEAFPVLPHWGGRSELYNAKTLWLADKRAALPMCADLRLLFDTQTGDDIAAVLAAYRGEAEAAPPRDFTRGLYFRKVE